jgi:hypothetical protein
MHAEVLSQALEAAASSDYFTGPRVADDLEQLLAAQEAECRAIGEELVAPAGRLYLVGSDGSFADVVGVKYTLDRLIATAVEAMASYELISTRTSSANEPNAAKSEVCGCPMTLSASAKTAGMTIAARAALLTAARSATAAARRRKLFMRPACVAPRR